MDGSSASAPASAITSTPTPPAPPVVLPPPSRNALEEISLAWPPAAQWAAVVLASLAAILLGVNALSLTSLGARPSEISQRDAAMYRVNINLADESELMQVPGVGPKTAQKIVQNRNRHGRFQTVEDLVRVKGIGARTLERLKNWVCVDGDELMELQQNRVDPKAAARNPALDEPGRQYAKIERKKKININTATAAQLQTLPRIGPVLSQRIIEERKKKRFTSVDDLQRVRGIGAKTVERLRPLVTVK